MMPPLGFGWCMTTTSSSSFKATRAERLPVYHASTLSRRYARVHGEPFAKSVSARSGFDEPPQTSCTKASGGPQTPSAFSAPHWLGSASGAGGGAASGSTTTAGGGGSSVGTGAG